MIEKLDKIMILDDEEDIRELIKTTLNDHGYENIYEAGNCDQAFNLARNNSFDLIISDIKMKDMSGIDFLKELRSINNTTWFIVISGYLDEELYNSGAYMCMSKPIVLEDFIFSIKRLELIKGVLTSYDQIFEDVIGRCQEIQTVCDDNNINQKLDDVNKMIKKRINYTYSMFFNTLVFNNEIE